MAAKPVLDHPSLPHVKEAFPDAGLKASEFRGMTTIVASPEKLHDLARFLRDSPECQYDFFSDIMGIDYLDYPAPMPGRFSVVYLLASTKFNTRLTLKTFVDPTVDTSGIDFDPGLEVDSVTDIWPGAEWPEREVYDMYGIRFRNHPDLRRILTWRDFPGHPLRKDYPLRGRGEREHYQTLNRESR